LRDKLLIVGDPFEGFEVTLFSQSTNERIAALLKIAENHVKVDLKQSLIVLPS
jgi:UDP-2,3-diacylglucosamine pyrophosphatase LpxH